MKRFLPFALLLALAPTASGAEAPSKDTAQQLRDAGVVCTYERTTGSHIKKRVCTTRDQRDERAELDREAARRHRDTPKALNPGD